MGLSNTRIYPSWEKIKNFKIPLTEAEEKFAHFLDKNLPEYWKIFVKPYFNGSYPDLILLNPDGGLMIYNVVSDSEYDTSPLKTKQQLDYYRNKIFQELVPKMGEKLDENKSIFVILKNGIYFHHKSGEEARAEFIDFPYISIIGYDDLNKESLNDIVPGVDYPRSKFMKKEWSDELEFWLNPHFHEDKRIGVELNSYQKEKSEPQPGHKRLRGVAGSGKTLIVAHRAARLASKGYKVLIVTYNRSLWYHIKDLVDQTPYNFEWSNLTFRHFHGFCGDILNELFIKTNFNNMIPLMENIIKNKSIDKFKFDAILIDEGQDYDWEWYNILSHFLKDRNELFFVCDKAQNIYEKNLTWVENMGDFPGKVQFSGRWSELSEVYRLPHKIAEMAKKFSEEFELDHSLKMDLGQSRLLNTDPPIFEWKNITDDDWYSYMVEFYEKIRQLDANNPSEIVVLIPKNRMGIEAVEIFEEKGIKTDHLFNSDPNKWLNKKTFSNMDGKLKLSTIHKFKGWEAKNVIMVIPEEWKGDENLDALVYTSFTRTLENLMVLNCNERYYDFGALYEKQDILKKEIKDPITEDEFEKWIETLPFHLSSILWAAISSISYEHKSKYLLQFFEAFSLFSFNLFLSGLSTDKLFFDMKLKECLVKESEYKSDWFEKPSFGVWNNLNYCLASLIRNELKNKHDRNDCVKRFGKVNKDFLNNLASFEIIRLLKKTSKYRNIWEGHGPRVSEKEYEERYNGLLNHLRELKEVLKDSFEMVKFVVPVSSSMENGLYDYTVKNLMTTRPPFRPVKIESELAMDNNRLYMVNPNKKRPLKILPLIQIINDIAYYYNGMENTGVARFNSYHNNQSPEKSIELQNLNDLTRLLDY